MANSNEVEYPPEATVGDQWLRGEARESKGELTRPSLSLAGLHQRISQVAYELYLRGGKLPGRDLDDWLAAESIVLSQLTQTKQGTGEHPNGEEEQ